LALAAAYLKGLHPISYADCFAAALAQQLDAAVVTGDPDFRQLEGRVAIEWLPGGEP
jgi:ribonuclease VapC